MDGFHRERRLLDAAALGEQFEKAQGVLASRQADEYLVAVVDKAVFDKRFLEAACQLLF